MKKNRIDINININESISQWYESIMDTKYPNDFILLTSDEEKLIWFISNLTQFLIRKGNKEVMPVYGRSINNLESFIDQVNLIMPVGYKLATRLDALYDLILNFETEPESRFIIWNDADILFKKNTKDFVDIFEMMIVSAFCNRNALSTFKADGTKYKVDQRNLFVFKNIQFSEIELLLEKEYFIPSIDHEQLYRKIDFNIINLIG